MLSAAKSEMRPARRIGKYLITGRIGRGGMGHVYRGLDEMLEREVAVKTLTVEGSYDEESRKRFEIEAKAAAKLQHPNIVTVFELGEDRGAPFIAMEMLPGADLETLMRGDPPLLLQEKLQILIQVCRGLAYAHQHNIVHRDIKPSNIRILEDGTAKIMDFGIAKLAGTGVTKTGMMVGTVHYMSPEQIRGRPLDGRSDIFSLGVILYEMLAGQRPFRGEGSTDVLYKIIQEPTPPLPPEALRESSPELQAIVERTLAKDAEDRCATAGELADELARLLAEHLRTIGKPAGEAGDAIQVARRLLKEGRHEEGIARLREAAAEYPSSLEVMRALRTATHELERRERSPEPDSDDEYPELESTFKPELVPTRREPETVLEPTLHRRSQPPQTELAEVAGSSLPSAAVSVPVRSPGLVVGAALALAVAVAAAGYLLTRPPAVVSSSPTPSQSTPASLKAGTPQSTPPGSTPRATLSVPVTSDPPGAHVTVDGQAQPGTTPLELKLDPALDHRLTVSADGYSSQEIRLDHGKVPTEVKVTLEPAGPPGKVTVAAAYPVDIQWRGRILAKGQAGAELNLPAGRQVVTLVSATYFLRTNIPVDVRAGATTSVDAPALGKLNIRANPDNCRVSVDGTFVDYPPILDRSVVVGPHSVSFVWLDGSHREEAVEVARSTPAYVMGRKD